MRRRTSALVALPVALPVALAVALVIAATTLVPGTATAVPGPMPASGGADTVHLRLRAAVKQLDIAAEKPAGYDRDEFKHWVDADDDCLDTREEVLAADSLVPVGDSCTVTAGEWFSYYDHLTWTQPSDVDIDHMVPLKEAWDSGAHAWDDDARERYANDLGDRRSLVAVTDNENQSKSDRDPAEWLPDFGVCRYVAEWTVVKTRWDLTVDRAEKRTLRRLAADCPNVQLTVGLA